MIDRIVLAPYFLILKFRHWLYDAGVRKSRRADVPTVCIGNITVGGTGKTPHTEMIVRMLLGAAGPSGAGETSGAGAGLLPEPSDIAVLSRGYKRKSKGFQQVVCGTDAHLYGDEPLQIKNKFPEITVAVDSDRYEGCDFLCHPEKLKTSKKARRCLHKDISKAPKIIILDDAYQHRSLKPDLNVLLIAHNRPIDKDMLLPLGRLRDLTERKNAADVIIVTKCPSWFTDEDREDWLNRLEITDFDPITCQGANPDGRRQTVLFSTIGYSTPEAVFPEGDNHYIYSHLAVPLTGIADDAPFIRHISGTYKLTSRLRFPDHHAFTTADINSIKRAADANSTSVLLTTEKDSQRLAGLKEVPETVRKRLFRIPIQSQFLTDAETTAFSNLLRTLLA